MSAPDYAHLLRLHAARWTVVFMALAAVWVTAMCVSLGLSDGRPALIASVLLVVATGICRTRYRQLRDAEDEALIRALRVHLEDL